MSKMIQAYFRTENDAEAVRIKLETIKTDNLEISELAEPMLGNRLVVPFAAAAPASGGPTGTGAGAHGTAAAPLSGLGAYAGIRSVEDANSNEEPKEQPEDLEDCTYVLSARVEDRDYDEVLQIISHNGGKVEKLDD